MNSFSKVNASFSGLVAAFALFGAASAEDCQTHNAMGRCGGPDVQTGTIYCYTNTRPLAQLCMSHPYQIERGQTIRKCVSGSPGKKQCQINGDTVTRVLTTYQCVGDSSDCSGVGVQPIPGAPELVETCLIDKLQGPSC